MTAQFEFLCPEEYRLDKDAGLREDWSRAKVKPVVFVQGLHRSGTTFLLNSLHEVTGAAALSVHDIAYYRHRVFGRVHGLEQIQISHILAFFTRYGLYHRPIDEVPLTAASLDEFGFIYDRLGISLTDSSLLFEIVTKLSFLYPNAPFVLLKDPHVFTASSSLSQVFPDAKFIFIHRDPSKTLLSQCRARLLRRSLFRDWAYLHLLTGRPPTWRKRISRFLPHRHESQVAMATASHILHEITRYNRDVAEVPSSQLLHLEYEDLVMSTVSALRRVGEFVNVPHLRPLTVYQPRERKRFHPGPHITAAAQWLCSRLRDAGYEHSSLRHVTAQP
jgi:Sulfotransferase family